MNYNFSDETIATILEALHTARRNCWDIIGECGEYLKPSAIEELGDFIKRINEVEDIISEYNEHIEINKLLMDVMDMLNH